jgi:hypothetical protein
MAVFGSSVCVYQAVIQIAERIIPKNEIQIYDQEEAMDYFKKAESKDKGKGRTEIISLSICH